MRQHISAIDPFLTLGTLLDWRNVDWQGVKFSWKYLTPRFLRINFLKSDSLLDLTESDLSAGGRVTSPRPVTLCKMSKRASGNMPPHRQLYDPTTSHLGCTPRSKTRSPKFLIVLENPTHSLMTEHFQ